MGMVYSLVKYEHDNQSDVLPSLCICTWIQHFSTEGSKRGEEISKATLTHFGLAYYCFIG
jgi:hypothetical protein